jgi:putative ABC transport system ATP-binding protein
LGFIFQNFNLLPVLSASENVAYPLTLLEDSGSLLDMRMRAEEALEAVGLLRFRDHKPMQLSGGQRQRVAIARALVTNPHIILADEPTANLDHKTGNEILELMKKLNRDRGTTFVFSTHDAKIMALADRIIEVQDGALVS